MKTRNYSALPLAALAALAALALGSTSAHATIVEINGIGGGNNVNLPSTFASNLSSDIGGATVSNGATPDIALVWALTGNGWERHGSNVWNAMDPATGTPDVAQVDYDNGNGTDEPTITFTVGAGVALQLNSLDIGHATDQNEADFAWAITITEDGGPQVFSHTTAAMGPGDTEAVVFNFTGGLGVDYILELDGADRTNRGALDNLSFNQVTGPDLTPPTIVSPTDPADGSTGVAVDTNFVATFSENIALTATGTITVTDGSETRVVNLDGSADDGDASVLDKVLTITLDTDLTNPSSSYDVLISNDAVVDTAPAQNPFAGTVSGDWNFTTVALDLTSPTIVPPTDPADDSTGVAVDTAFVATFSENIALTAIGTITVTDGSETRVVNLDGSADDGDASVLDDVLTITLDTDLTNLNSSYDVLMSNDAIVDTAPAQNPFAGTVSGDWNFTTSDGSGGGSLIVFNGIAGGNNAGIPTSFGSNLSSDIGGATVSNGGTPNIALAWAGGAGGWDLHGGGGAGFWAALDSDTATTPSIGQMESPTAASPNTVTFTVDSGWALQLNSVDLGMATDKTDTYYWNVTISELGGSEVFSTLTAAMDGDGGSGAQALTVALNFTGTLGMDYVLAFNDVDGSGNDTINTNGGAIDNLSFGQVIPGPDLTPPTIASANPFNPADDSTDVSISANLAVTFNETVVFGTGSITIRESVGNGLVESFDVETSPKLLLSDRTVTIDPTLDLAAATGYYVQIDPTAIDDTSGNDFAGIADTSTWNFTSDATPPSIGTVDSPVDGASDVSTDSELVLTFSEDVQIGSGNIVIRRISDNSVVVIIDVGGANVTVDGSQVTIVPPSDLPELTGLYVEVDAGAFLDLAGYSFAGVSGSGTWSFTTAAAFRLFIAPNGADFDFSWTSRIGKAYDLLSSTDLATPSAGWDVYDPDGAGGIPAYENIPSDGLLTTLTAVSASGPRRFFVVSEKDAPPVVLVEAHRGYSQIAPENTVASIEAAVGFADLSEMDVQVTSDGILVLMHDGTVNRTTDGSGSVGSMTLAQIQLLDAGSWFSAAFVDEPVPTMAEAINACLTNNIEPLIERKGGAAAVYHAEFVSLGLNASEFRVISFDSNFLAALDALNPDYRLGHLSSGTITQAVIDDLKAKGVDFLDWNAGGVNQAAVDLVHANGMELHVWTVNGSSQMQQLIDFGVDGITTDNPALLRSLLP